ncbi:MAG: LysE family translocator [Acidimicrobiales bacterium]
MLYIVTRSIDQGRRAGLTSVLGIHAGSLVNVAAAILGLRRLRSRRSDVDMVAAPVPLSRVFAQGLVVNLFNPKTAIFFLAFLPQFVHPGAGPVPVQLAIFGALFVLLGLLSDGTYAMASAALGSRLGRGHCFERAHRWGAGLACLGLGVAAAVPGSRAHSA